MEYSILNRLDAIKDAISTLQNNRATHGAIDEKKLAELQPLLATLGAENTHNVSMFMHRYITRALDYLHAFYQLAEDAKIQSYTTPYLLAAANCFLDKHPAISTSVDPQTYLRRAYLSHRMLEELNDRVRTERGWSLAPTDTTYVNIIAHTLIGEETANLLDQTVLVQLEITNVSLGDAEKRVFQQNNVKALLENARRKGWGEAIERWPFLDEDMVDILEAGEN